MFIPCTKITIYDIARIRETRNNINIYLSLILGHEPIKIIKSGCEPKDTWTR